MALFVSWILGDGISNLGYGVAAVGGALVAWAIAVMRRSLTPFPMPRRDGELVTRGPYRFLRHPMYVGAFLFFLGGSLVLSAWGLVVTAAIGLFWIAKARLEERYLVARFPEYATYRRRTLF